MPVTRDEAEYWLDHWAKELDRAKRDEKADVPSSQIPFIQARLAEAARMGTTS